MIKNRTAGRDEMVEDMIGSCNHENYDFEKFKSITAGLVWYLLVTVYCMKNCMQYAVYRTILHAVCSILQVKLHDAVQKTRCFTYRTTSDKNTF